MGVVLVHVQHRSSPFAGQVRNRISRSRSASGTNYSSADCSDKPAFSLRPRERKIRQYTSRSARCCTDQASICVHSTATGGVETRKRNDGERYSVEVLPSLAILAESNG